MAYAVIQDVYDLGLSAQAFVVAPRGIDKSKGDSLDFAAGIFRMIGHGFAATDAVEIVLVATGTVPGGATANIAYQVQPIDFFRFRLALAGAQQTFADAGSGWAIQIDPERRLQRHLDDGASRIDECLTAYGAPLKIDPVTLKYPTQIIGLNARLAARTAVPTLLFAETAAFKSAIDRLDAKEKTDEVQLATWLAGKPMNPAGTDQDTAPNDTMRARGYGYISPIPYGPRFVKGML